MNNIIKIGKITIKQTTLFILLLIAISFVYEYNKIFSYRPMSIHQWRSCVSASIAQGYYYDGSFLPSKVGAQIADNKTTDKVVIEFPLFYYIVSIFYRIFGFHEFIFKLLNVTLGFISLLYLFKTISLLFNKYSLISYLVPILLFTSPIYAFYLNNFLPETTSLSVSIFGFYFFIKFYLESKNKDLIISLLFFTIAGLLKVTSLLIFFGIFCALLIEMILKINLKSETKLFAQPIQKLMYFIVVILIIFSWYLYSRIYSNNHSAVLSAVDVRPFWDTSSALITKIWEQLKFRFRTGNYHTPIYLILSALLFIHNIIFVKKYNSLLSIITFVVFLEVIAFNILFYWSIGRCDYYQINNLILLVLIFLNFSLFLKNNYFKIFQSKYFKIIIIIGGILLINDCRFYLQKQRYGGYWYNSTITTIEKYGYITPYLRNLGINRNDLVYVTPDITTNVSLYLMDQKGYTDYALSGTTKQKIDKLLKKGIQYLIIGDSTIYKEDLSPYIEFKVGEFNGVDIYKLNN